MAKGTIQILMDIRVETIQTCGKIGSCLVANVTIFGFSYSLHHDAYLKIRHILENRHTEESHEFWDSPCAYMLYFSCRFLPRLITKIPSSSKLALHWPLTASTSCHFTVVTIRHVEFLDFYIRRTIAKCLLYSVISMANTNLCDMEALDFCSFYTFRSENEKLSS